MPSYSISLSGLLANEEALSVIANNLSNLNTTGYKGLSPQFSDLFGQLLGLSGSGDPIQAGAGTTIGSIETLFTQGSIQNTGLATDMAIQGDGYFQTEKDGMTLYTRDGNFMVNAQGYLTAQDGAEVLGYGATDGVLNPAGALTPLLINTNQSSPPKATSTTELAMNLDASATPASATTSVDLNLGLDETASAGATYSTTAAVYDSNGVAHNLNYTFTAKGNDQWDVAITIPAADVGQSGGPVTIYDSSSTGYQPLTFPKGGGAITSPVGPVAISLPGGTSLVSGGTLSFNWVTAGTTEGSGDSSDPVQTGGAAGTPAFSTSATVFDSLGTSHILTYTFTKTASNTWSYQITIPAGDVGSKGSPTVLQSGSLAFDANGNLTTPSSDVTGIVVKGLADGAADLNVTWKLFDANGTSPVTQVAGSSATSSTRADGYGSGSIINFSVGPGGTITGTFSNGQSMVLGQVALATFPNSEGLLRTGSNSYMASLASGLPTVGAPGTGGRGSIVDGGLESSNVDIATQFAALILAQRGYEANARSFTANDQIIQDTLNLGH